MDIKLDINPEAIQQEVTRAIIASSLGNSIEEAIKAEVAELRNTFNRSMKIEIQKAITNHICELLKTEEYSSMIKQAVTDRLSSNITDDFIDIMVKTSFEKIERNYY